MITDSLENLDKYRLVISRSKEISDYLKSTSLASLQEGRYQIAGESVFVLIQKYSTKMESEKKWESHRKYIDIQIVLKGEEFMGYSPASRLVPLDEYNKEKDIIFYKDDSQSYSMLFVRESHFGLFFPEEAHKPGLHISKEVEIKKAVIKVAAS